MGLSLFVGVLAELDEDDPDGAATTRGYFEEVNRFLVTRSLPVHHEPTRCETWSCSMYGYAGVHYLRRIAAHLDFTGKLPAPGTREAHTDPLVTRYYQESAPTGKWSLGAWFRRRPQSRSFDHLMIHSDAEGYYLPQNFREVLVPPDSFKIPGGMIGSSHRLLAETQALAAALALPLNLDPENSEVFAATECQGQGGDGWQNYGVESYTCLQLYRAAQESVRTGAAIVFS